MNKIIISTISAIIGLTITKYIIHQHNNIKGLKCENMRLILLVEKLKYKNKRTRKT